MGPEILALLTIGGAATTAATTVVGAQRQNRAIRESVRSQREAASAQAMQLSRQAQTERAQQIRQLSTIRGKIRVAAGESGVGMSGSMALLENQAEFDAARNLSTIGANLAANVQRVQSGLAANTAQLQAMEQNPILAGFMGGLQGFQTGLSISQAGIEVGRYIKDLKGPS